MKNFIRYPFFPLSILGLGVLLSFQNCAQNYGVTSKNNPDRAPASIEPVVSILPVTGGAAPVAASQPIPLPAAPIIQVPETTPSVPPVVAVCDPLNENSDSSKMAIQGELYYRTEKPVVRPNGALVSFDKVDDYIDFGKKVEGTMVFLNQVYTLTRMFDRGFESSTGQVLMNEKKEKLIEYFALKLESRIKLDANEEEGLYQLALLSDDGSILEVNSGNGYEISVQNDKNHPTRLTCGSIVQMKKGRSLPMKLKYYQGPKFHIALTLLWRKVDQRNLSSKSDLCNGAEIERTGNDMWADVTKYPSTASAKFNQLISKEQGWKVLAPANFSPVSNLNQACLQ